MNKFRNYLIPVSCFLAMLGVAMGAIGKHWAESFLLSTQLDTISTATFYHQLYSLLVFFLAYFKCTNNNCFIKTTTIYCFMTGMIIFSGSLYLYVFLNYKFFAMITPIGGILLMVSWILVFIDFLKRP